jgi:hypothetical protein
VPLDLRRYVDLTRHRKQLARQGHFRESHRLQFKPFPAGLFP